MKWQINFGVDQNKEAKSGRKTFFLFHNKVSMTAKDNLEGAHCDKAAVTQATQRQHASSSYHQYSKVIKPQSA